MRLLVLRPLSQVVRYAADLKLSNLNQALTLKRISPQPDEMQQLADSMNAMRQSLLDEINRRLASEQASQRLQAERDAAELANRSATAGAAAADVAAAAVAAGVDGCGGRPTIHGSPLHAAARSEPVVLHTLVAAGCHPDITDKLGLTPLHDAAAEGKADSVRILLAAGADPAIRDR